VPFLRAYLTHVRLFSRNARLYLAGTFFFGFGVGTYWVLLNLYFRELGLSEGTIGRILSFQALGTMLMAVPASMLAARLRFKWILIGATLLAATAYALLVVLKSVTLLFAVATLAGAAFIIHHVVAAPFFMRNSNREERIYLFGLNYAVEILTSVVGVAGGGWLARFLGVRLESNLMGLRLTLLGSAWILALAVFPYMGIRSPRPISEKKPGTGPWPIRFPKILPKLLLPALLVGTGAGLVIPFLNLYFRDRFGLQSDAIGQIFAISQALTAVGFVLGPILARRFGMVRTAAASELLSVPFFTTLALSFNLPLSIAAFWLRGALMNMNQPVSRNFAMEVVKPHEQAFTNAAVEMTWSGAWMFSTRIGGWLIETHGFKIPMLIAVGLYVTASSLYLRFFHDTERQLKIHVKAASPPDPEPLLEPRG
jgi:MFS family permease